MSKRGPGPTLYDLIQDANRPSPDGPRLEGRHAPTQEPRPIDDGGVVTSLLRPGRQVAVPIGVVLVALAIVAAAIVGAFIFGHKSGEDAADAKHQEAWVDEASRSLSERPQDPLAQGSGGSSGTPAGLLDGDVAGGADSGPDGGSAGAGEADQGSGLDLRAGNGRWGELTSPDRVAGMYYYVVAETRHEGAMRLGAFLRAEGLEAYVVLGNNAGSRDRVIVFPGFDGLKSSAERLELERSIRRAGQLWKSQNRGESDLSDFYASRFDG